VLLDPEKSCKIIIFCQFSQTIITCENNRDEDKVEFERFGRGKRGIKSLNLFIKDYNNRYSKQNTTYSYSYTYSRDVD